MKELVRALEEVEQSLKSGTDSSKTQKALESAASKVSSWSSQEARQLSEELSVWKTKLSVIWKEPAGRQGMAKHTRHWIEKIHG